MDLQTLAALGEFIGGIGGFIAAFAVVASLVFVGIQIKASVRQASVDSYSTVTELWTNFTNTVAADEQVWRVFYDGIRDYESLAESVFPVIKETGLRATLGILARTVAPGAARPGA